MNNIVIVSVDSESNERDYRDLGDRLTRGYLPTGSDCRVTKNTWCFNTDRSPEEIYNFLQQQIIHRDDKVFVARIDGAWHTNGTSMQDCYKRPR